MSPILYIHAYAGIVMGKQKFTCPKCHEVATYNFALSRRNVGYADNGKICNKCATTEAFVDESDWLSDDVIHWEYSFHQLCCGNATQDGMKEFDKWLRFRKAIGKHDPPLWEVHNKIWLKMFGTSLPDKMRQEYIEQEESWTVKPTAN